MCRGHGPEGLLASGRGSWPPMTPAFRRVDDRASNSGKVPPLLLVPMCDLSMADIVAGSEALVYP